MATETEQLVVSLEARIRDFERNFRRAGATADQRFSAVERRARQSAERLDRVMGSTALSVNRALGAIGAGVSFDQVRRYADAWTQAGNKIRAAAAATGVQARSLDELKASANEARTSLEDYSDLYARLIRSAAGVAKNEGEIARATSITAKAFKAGGASASEQASGILQLGQALGSGVLQGDELRSLRENAPILAKAIADAFKVPVSALKSLGEQGKLTSEKVFAAILAAGPKVEAQFKATTATIGDSFTRLSNELTAYVGKTAEANGVSAAFRAVLDGLASNIGAVTNAAAAAAAILLGSYIPNLARAATATVALVATNPFLLIATAAGAAVFAVSAFGDKIQPIAGDLANLQDYAAVSWDAIKLGATTAADAISAAFRVTVDYLSNALAGVGVSWQDLAAVTRGVANAIVNSFAAVHDVILTTFSQLPAAIAEATISAVNGMIATIESGLNGVIALVNAAVDAINKVGGKVGVELGKVGSIDLGRIANDYAGAGEKAATAYADAFRQMSKDRVGEALAGINAQADAALDNFRKRANDRAARRQTDATSAKAASEAGKTAPITGGKTTFPVELTKGYADIQQRIAALQAETAIRRAIPGSIEQAEAALERQRVAQQLVNDAVKEGVVINDDVKSKIGALADAYSKASQEAKALAQSQQDAAAKAKEFEDSTKDTFRGFIKDLAHGKSASEALASALGKLGEKFLDMALDQLWSQTFGKNNPLFGGITGTLFPTTPNVVKAPGSPLQGVNFDPNGVNTPAATVNAGSVTVTGATTGALSATGTGPSGTLGTAPVPKVDIKDLPPIGSTAGTASLNGLSPEQLRAALVDRTMKDFGLTKEQASGLVGNLSQETNGFRNFQELRPLVPGSRGGYGLAQWTGPRRREFEAFAAQQGKPTSDLDAQYEFLKRELNGQAAGGFTPGTGLDGLRQTSGLSDSALYFRQNFLRPGIPHDDARLSHAQQALDDFNQIGAQQPAFDTAQLQQQLQQLQQPIANIGQTALQVTPNLGGMASGVTGLVGPLAQAVPGLGQFGGAISGLLSQLASGIGGGSGIGSLFGFAEGGQVKGPGTSTSDSIPAMLSNGEFVVNSKSAAKHAPLLAAINEGRVPAFATGGIVGSNSFAASQTYAPNLTVNVSGATQGNRLAQQIAAETARALSNVKPDTFKRTAGQQMAEASAQLNRAATKNN